MERMAVPISKAVCQSKMDPLSCPPDWVHQLLGGDLGQWVGDIEGMRTRLANGGPFALASVCVPGAATLDEIQFQERTSAAYRALARLLADNNAQHPVRIWNLIPGILEPLGSQAHRYMSFNAGRHNAYSEWFQSQGRFDRQIATASGVGHDGEDLVLHCLAATTPGIPVENPRQVPAYRYSRRYGRLPPCFARATRIDGGDGTGWLLVGGTASVRGEETVHISDLAAQAQETFGNLLALVGAACERPQPAETRPGDAACFRYLRAYYVNEGDAGAVQRMVSGFFAETEVIDYCQAELCRPDLLIEIEGVAQLPG